MSNTLPVTFRAAPMDPLFSGNTQQLVQAIVERLSIQSDESFSIFTTGATVPTSNIGPFLKDGTTWWVWSPTAGAYVPEILDSKSLRYIASETEPAQANYTFWIKLVAGKAVGVYYYSGGAWKDVYEDKFLTFPTNAQMNTAIAAAITTQAAADAVARNQYPFKARKSAAPQIYTAGSGDIQIVFDVEDYDFTGNFAANQYVAPKDGPYHFKASTYISLDSGTPTAIDRQIKLRVNGVVVARKNVQVSDATGGATLDISADLFLSEGDIVDVVINVDSTGASDWSLLNDSTETYFCGFKIIYTP